MNDNQNASQSSADPLARYVRQSLFAPLGTEGQERLQASRALICGCGALGSVAANTLARAGVGKLRIVDRDFLELNNLQRQVLFDENDVASGIPKAVAAQQRLAQINSQVEVEAVVADVDYRNVLQLFADVDVVLDGTDNFETRFLLNDAAIKTKTPWIYGGCIGAEGQTMSILPERTACLRCLMRESPPPGTTPTCDTAGILGPIINVIASIEACEAIKILAGRWDAVSDLLHVIDLWDNRIRQINLSSLRDNGECPTCHQHQFLWLEGVRGGQSAVLCGRNSVQLTFEQETKLSLDRVAEKLKTVGKVQVNAFLLRLEVEGFQLTVFPDGRAIIGGTEDIAEAKTVYAKYIGH